MNMRLGHKTLVFIGLVILTISLAGCGSSTEEQNPWFMSLSLEERFLYLAGVISALFVIPLILLLIFGQRDHNSRNDAYFFYLAIVFVFMLAIMAIVWVVSLLWSLVMWVVANFIIIAIVVLSLFLLVAIINGADKYNNNQTNWIIATFITSVVIVALVMGQMGILSALRVDDTVVLIIAVSVLIFLVIAMIQALADRNRYGNSSKWWFLSALIAVVVAGIIMPITIESLFSNLSISMEGIALSFIQSYLWGSIIGIIFFPVQVGRALYKIIYKDDVTITHTRIPRVQHQYVNAGYRCGKCGGSLPGEVSRCPHCGVQFSGMRNQYLKGTPPPKETTKTTRNTTPLAGFSLLVLLLLDMVYGISLFEIWHRISMWDSTSVIYIVGGPIINLIIVGIAVFLMGRYAKTRGNIERVSYY